MIQKLKQSILILAMLALPAFALAAPAPVFASHIPGHVDIEGELDKGSCLGSACPTESGEDRVNRLIASVVNIFSLIVGVVAVIMIIVGGFRYITSGGESNNVTAAKNTILYAIIGLIIVALAQFIVRFVLARVT